jgi:hypothetical protein
MNDMDVPVVRTALSNLLAAVLRINELRGPHIHYPDLDIAIEEARQILGYPFVSKPEGDE